MHLARFPRVSLGHFPTPLEPLDNLSKLLGGPKIWIKRDDATGLASGGNKTRKLEFLLADALAKNADVVITQGATQSNHVRQTIAGAARLGLQAKALLEQRVTDFGEDYQRSGNVLLDELLGGEIVAHLPGGSDMQQAMEEYAATLREQGHTPYIIPGGGSNPIGALGYVACAEELFISHLSYACASITWFTPRAAPVLRQGWWRALRRPTATFRCWASACVRRRRSRKRTSGIWR